MTKDPDEVNDETLPTVATVHAETQTDERMTQPSGFLSYTLIKDSDERTSYYTGLEKYALLIYNFSLSKQQSTSATHSSV